MADDDPTHPRHRQTVGADDVAVIRKLDGRVWRVNWPSPGRITVEFPEEPDRATEEHDLATYLHQEERQG
jgi:hypothetical protein